MHRQHESQYLRPLIRVPAGGGIMPPPACLLLDDCGTSANSIVGDDVLHGEADYIAAAERAVDCQVEERETAGVALRLEADSDGPVRASDETPLRHVNDIVLGKRPLQPVRRCVWRGRVPLGRLTGRSRS